MTMLLTPLIRRIALKAALLVLLTSALPLQSFAADRDTSAEKIVSGLVGDMWQILKQDGVPEPERTSAVADRIEAGTDTRLLGRLVLGNVWRQLTDDQKERYLQHFPAFITTTLAGQIVAASDGVGDDLDQHFTLVGSEKAGDRDAIVQTEITTPQAKALRVDWRFRDRKGRLTLIDVLIDGVSLLITKRNEFGAIVEQRSVDDLLTELERVGDQTTG